MQNADPLSSQLIYSILHSKSAIHQLPPHLEKLAIKAYASSLSIVWITASAIAILTVLSSFFIQEKSVGGDKDDGDSAKAGGSGASIRR